MNFYIIELKDRLKIGISKKDVKIRISNILSQGGHGQNDVLNLFEFPDTGIIEAPLKLLFKPYLIERNSINRGSEWFYKKGLVELFINKIKFGSKPSRELVEQIQYEHIPIENGLKQAAIFIFEKIKKERKGIGFPNSVMFEHFIKTKKMAYRNMIYWVNSDFTGFTREPKFDIINIKESQEIECLRIIKNNTKSIKQQDELQAYIDDVFNKIEDSHLRRINLIEQFFFKSIDIQKIKNKNVRIVFDKEFDYYYFKEKYNKLTPEEYVLIKESKNTTLLSDRISIDYKGKMCICEFDLKDISRIRNLLKNISYTDFSGAEKIQITNNIEKKIKINKLRPMKRLDK